jgi:hypothetical protein
MFIPCALEHSTREFLFVLLQSLLKHTHVVRASPFLVANSISRPHNVEYLMNDELERNCKEAAAAN